MMIKDGKGVLYDKDLRILKMGVYEDDFLEKDMTFNPNYVKCKNCNEHGFVYEYCC